MKRIAGRLGCIDILVNLAGITARIPSTEMPLASVRRLTEVNYYGVGEGSRPSQPAPER